MISIYLTKHRLILGVLLSVVSSLPALATCKTKPFAGSITCNCQIAKDQPVHVTRYTKRGDNPSESCTYCEEDFIGQTANCQYVYK